MDFDRTAFTISCAEALTNILRKYRTVLFIPRKDENDSLFVRANILGNIEQIEKLILRLGNIKSREDADIYFLVYETDFTIGINIWDEFNKFWEEHNKFWYDSKGYDALIANLVSDMCYILDKRWHQLLKRTDIGFFNENEKKTYKEMMEKDSTDTGINIKDYM